MKGRCGTEVGCDKVSPGSMEGYQALEELPRLAGVGMGPSHAGSGHSCPARPHLSSSDTIAGPNHSCISTVSCRCIPPMPASHVQSWRAVLV